MIYIAICDDNKKSVEILESKVSAWLKENHKRAEVHTYTQSQMLQYDIEEGQHYDLILSDIEMPQIDGMDLAAYMKRYLPDVLIIFITSHLKYAVDAFELSVFRYIPKNMIGEKLSRALTDAVKMIELQENEYYCIQTAGRVEKIPYRQILYIYRQGKNAVFSLKDGKETRVRKSLSQVFQELNSEDFFYVDRGDIVNLAYVMNIRNSMIELKDGSRLLVSQGKLEEVKERLGKFWGEQL